MTTGEKRKFSAQDSVNRRRLLSAIYAAICVGIFFSSLCFFFVTEAPMKAPAPSSITYDAPNFFAADAAPDVKSVVVKQGKMPPLSSFKLTKDFVSKRAKDNAVIAAFGNFAVMEFIVNWAEHLEALGLHNFIIGATDLNLLESLHWRGYPVFYMGSNTSTGDLSWGTEGFYKIGRERARLVDAILPFGFDVLISDTDVVWVRNPLPYFARYPDADVLTSTDELAPTVVDGALEIWNNSYSGFNVGIMFFRSTVNSKKFAQQWKELLLRENKAWDQGVFNKLMRENFGPSVEGGSGLVYAFDGKLMLGILPSSVFCSGHTYFVQAMPNRFDLKPYAVHATHQFSGPEGKRHALREGMLFNDPPEYYNMPGGYLSFNPAIPKHLLYDGQHNVESHFELVNYQIKQIRTALSVASLLGRTLIMPPLWCRLDKLFSAHPGIVPGSVTQQPFLCPLGHVFKVNYMFQDLPEDEYGPMIEFREHSFLDNPLLPKQVKDSMLYVDLCEEGVRGCNVSNSISSYGVFRFPKNSDESTLTAAFSRLRNVKVIHFSTMKDGFRGFAEKSVEEKFRKRVKTYLDRWCCVMNAKPGHIYYDMYWDEKPGWKPEPPKTEKDDHPPR